MIRRCIKNIRTAFVFVAVLSLCTGVYANKEDIKRERPGKLFSPSKIPLLEDARRDTWQKPEEILNALDIKEGQTVADIGAGSGYLTVKLSERVGMTGTIYAADIQQEMLEAEGVVFDRRGYLDFAAVRWKGPRREWITGLRREL